MTKLLIKTRLSSLICAFLGKRNGSKQGKASPSSRGKIIGFAILYIFLIIYFLFLSVSVAVSLAAVILSTGADWLYFGVFLLIDFAFLFLFSIFETKSELCECKDNDLLLSMPIKPLDIVVSRISVVLIYNYLEQILIMLPCIVVYAIFTGNIMGVIGATVASLFIPLLVSALSSAVGYIIAVISRRIKRKTLVATVISLIFIVVFYIGYSALIKNIEGVMEGLGAEIIITPDSAPFFYHLGSALTFKPLNLILLILISLLCAFVAFFIISKNYIKITTDTASAKRTVYKGEITKQKSSLMTLVSKEIRKFLSSTTYMMNSAIGIVFTLILAVVAVINRSELIELSVLIESELGFGSEVIYPIMISAIVILSSMNMQSASALSLEGNNLWCLKSMPISDREVLLSKAIPQILITTPPSTVASVLFIIATGAPLKYWAFYILTPIAANILFALLGIVINVAFPKFDFENEVQPIKQSMAVFLVMMSQLVISLLCILLGVFISIFVSPIISASINLGLFTALAFAFYFILVGPCVKKYSSIEP